MANTKISNLTEDTAPTGGNYFVEVDDTGGTPTTKRVNGSHFVEMGERNYKIVVTIASNNITVALKNLAGNDFSATDPLVVKIGNTWRTVAAALSVTVNAATNSFNAGAAEFATKEIDYFVYLGWKSAATAAVVIGFSRIPWANVYSDFSATATNEKYGAFSTAPAATDDVINIGRIAATLSAGAGYTWTSTSQSAPTTTNTIQRPVFETRFLDYLPSWTGGSPAIGNGTLVGKYIIRGPMMWYGFHLTAGTTTTFGSGTLSWSLPFTVAAYTSGNFTVPSYVFDSSANTFYIGVAAVSPSANTATMRTSGAAGAVSSAIPVTLATSDQIQGQGSVILN